MITALILAVALLVPVSAVLADTLLSGKEIKQLINNNTAVGSRIKQAESVGYPEVWVQFKTYYGADRKMVDVGYAASGGAPFPAHGDWKVTKQNLCFSYRDSKKDRGKLKCVKVIKKIDGTYDLFRGDGSAYGTWNQILPGNHYNLK
ncbi:hypothetical protein JV46_25430 [Solemya velum gill symbiont]|uniref:Uncharacterized protein n=2 Tax=Solemya velum gill symbiont TaxID=2340 RepID=A0A0B0HAQ1_SOVGS|nr:hypothetical protein JV46_25430 [Solemya velum gill symbiont]